jgi:ribose/xylose/arabinose/galactoside ABC-type transport system permease subunit
LRIFKTKLREMILILVIVLVGFVATLVNKNFLTVNNISNIFNIASPLGIMSLGATLIIASGNIDCSVGAQLYALCTLCGYLCKLYQGENVMLIILISMVGGILLGLINGVLVAYLRLPAIVVTLAMLSIIRGVVLLFTGGAIITGLEGRFVNMAMIKLGPVYITPIIWFFVVFITYILLYRMRIGREILAVGGNPMAAARIGINKKRIYIFVFTFAGLLAGIAAPMYTAKVGTIQAVVGHGYEMKLISAVVIGGTAFSGGVASLLGTFCGIALLFFIDNMLVLMHVPAYWQDLTVGAILLIAIVSSAFKGSDKINVEKNSEYVNLGNGGGEKCL